MPWLSSSVYSGNLRRSPRPGSPEVLLLAAALRSAILELLGVACATLAALAHFLTLAHMVWMINLYSFIDGMDGFAGGIAAFGFAAFAALGWLGGDAEFALLNPVIASSASGFLLDHYPPTRIFLGDAGSATLGLLAAVMFLVGNQRDLFPLWVTWLAFSQSLVDATWTLLRRAARGDPVTGCDESALQAVAPRDAAKLARKETCDA